jgi:hypothetical protein
MTRDDADNHENLTMTEYFKEEDEVFPTANYDGAPEFSIFERENFSIQEGDKMPSVSLSSNLAPNELAPLPVEFNLNY